MAHSNLGQRAGAARRPIVYHGGVRTYVLKRVLSLIPTLIGVTVLVFLMIRLIPGTVVDQMIGTEARASEETKAAMRAYFGLDQPLPVQYGRWVGGLVQGDLGVSWRNGLSVRQLIFDRLAVTLELAAGALLISLLIGVPLGILSAVKEDTALDHVARLVSLFSLSIPIFWQAAMLILALSLWFNWVPPVEYASLARDPVANLKQMILPMVVLGTVVAAQVMRMTRASLLEVMRQDFVRTARAKGLASRQVYARHVMRNALLPVVTVIGLQLPRLVAGTVIFETIFGLPGVGRYLLDAIGRLDYPVIQATNLVFGLTLVLSNLVVDLSYAWIDPRIKLR